jgi:hypothetical protein
MTVQQTLTIPKATTHLSVDLVQPIPAGEVDVVLFFPTPTTDRMPKKSASGITPQEAHAKLSGMFKGSTFTVDKLLEERRADLVREEKRYKRLFHKE